MTASDIPGDPIKCQNRRKDGRSCRHTIAVQFGPMVVAVGNGGASGDPAWTLCPRCGNVTHWRAGADDAPTPFRPSVDRGRQPVALTA